jgi:DNA-binding GntR family transcriptional regulator
MVLERPKPIVEQVNEILRERIRSTAYQPGQKLPSESDFASEFQVSRATIRTVLARLEVTGLIIRKQGDGTYVNERLSDVNTHLGGLWEFTQLIASSGYQASIQAVETTVRTATDEESEILSIASGDDVLELKRVFLADGQAVILAHNILPKALLVKSSASIDGTKPIRAFVNTYCQREIAYAISDIRATLVNAHIADTLAQEIGNPILKLKMIFYDKNNLPLLYGMSYFDDSALKLRLVQAWG